MVNPWYWLWAPALSTRSGRVWVAAAGVSAGLSCLNTTVLMEASLWPASGAATPYAVCWPLAILQLSVIGAAWTFERVRAAGRPSCNLCLDLVV